MNLNGIMIGSADVARLREYYTALFGEPEFADGGFAGWRLGSGMLVVGPHDQVHGENTEPGRLMWNVETADVKGEYDKLVAAGARSVREPYTPAGAPDGVLIATLADPDENYFQLVGPM